LLLDYFQYFYILVVGEDKGMKKLYGVVGLSVCLFLSFDASASAKEFRLYDLKLSVRPNGSKDAAIKKCALNGLEITNLDDLNGQFINFGKVLTGEVNDSQPNLMASNLGNAVVDKNSQDIGLAEQLIAKESQIKDLTDNKDAMIKAGVEKGLKDLTDNKDTMIKAGVEKGVNASLQKYCVGTACATAAVMYWWMSGGKVSDVKK